MRSEATGLEGRCLLGQSWRGVGGSAKAPRCLGPCLQPWVCAPEHWSQMEPGSPRIGLLGLGGGIGDMTAVAWHSG